MQWPLWAEETSLPPCLYYRLCENAGWKAITGASESRLVGMLPSTAEMIRIHVLPITPALRELRSKGGEATLK